MNICIKSLISILSLYYNIPTNMASYTMIFGFLLDCAVLFMYTVLWIIFDVRSQAQNTVIKRMHTLLPIRIMRRRLYLGDSRCYHNILFVRLSENI